MKGPIKKASAVIKVTDFMSYREYLDAVYRKLKKEVDGYNFERFADELGFGPTNVIRLALSGHRNLSVKAGERIVSALELKNAERRYFLALIRHNDARRPDKREEYFRDLLAIKQETLPSRDHQARLEYFSEWYHPVIREMTNMQSFRSNPRWIAGKLHRKIRPMQIEHSLSLLENLGLVRYDRKTGRFNSSGEQVVVDRHIDSLAVIRYHQQMLELAQESIVLLPEEDRDMNAMTITCTASTIGKVRDILEKALEEIFKLESEDKNRPIEPEEERLLQINTQLFCLVKGGKSEP